MLQDDYILRQIREMVRAVMKNAVPGKYSRTDT